MPGAAAPGADAPLTRPADPDQGPVGIGDGEFPETPGLGLHAGADRPGQRLDILRIEIDAVRVAVRIDPAGIDAGQMDAGALRIVEDAIAMRIVNRRRRETELLV